MSSPRCAIVRVHNFFYTHWCILQWPSYADPASIVDCPVSAARDGVVGVIHFIFCNLEMIHGKMLVSVVLALLVASKKRLSEKELKVVVFCQDVVLDDVMSGGRLNDGSKVLYWYHRQC